jgi:hypothetical protein
MSRGIFRVQLAVRVYVHEAATPAMAAAIEAAEHASMSICDVCSMPGKLRTTRDALPVATRCDAHVGKRG